MNICLDIETSKALSDKVVFNISQILNASKILKQELVKRNELSGYVSTLNYYWNDFNQFHDNLDNELAPSVGAKKQTAEIIDSLKQEVKELRQQLETVGFFNYKKRAMLQKQIRELEEKIEFEESVKILLREEMDATREKYKESINFYNTHFSPTKEISSNIKIGYIMGGYRNQKEYDTKTIEFPNPYDLKNIVAKACIENEALIRTQVNTIDSYQDFIYDYVLASPFLLDYMRARNLTIDDIKQDVELLDYFISVLESTEKYVDTVSTYYEHLRKEPIKYVETNKTRKYAA